MELNRCSSKKKASLYNPSPHLFSHYVSMPTLSPSISSLLYLPPVSLLKAY